MDFEKLKKEIEKTPNKKFFPAQLSIIENDNFRITSALYSNDIYCDSISTVEDIYNIVNIYHLDNYPYYITVDFKDFNENTINIINQLDSSIYIQIETRETVDVKKAELLSKINHQNCQFRFAGAIHQTVIESLSKLPWNSESSPYLIIDEINSNTINEINLFCNATNNPEFRIEIKDSNSLQNLYTIIPYIPNNEILVILDNNLFAEKNPNNARNLIVLPPKAQIPQDKKINFLFNNIEYESIEQIYELERHLEIIKSHIPSNANKLDIVTYVSLFIINYFIYDYDMYEKNIKNINYDEINLLQFISRGKGVCRHFADFTEYLLNSLGVECKRIDDSGDRDINSETEAHAFNVVKIDGKMYFLDNTWLAGSIQSGEIHSLAESSDFLTSNADFGHEDYHYCLEEYECETYDKEKIKASIARVLNWNQNYKIHIAALRDLFRKYILKKELSIDEKIENAIPRRG